MKRPFGERKYSTLGFGLYSLNYFGDLAPRPNRFSTDLRFTRPAMEVSYSHKYGPNLKVQGRVMVGVLAAADAESSHPHSEIGRYRYRRNASFRNVVSELSVVSVFEHPFNHGFYIHRHEVTYYILAGVGVLFHNPKAKAPATDLQGNVLPQAGDWVELRPLGTEGQYSELQPGDANFGIKPYSLIQPCIPIGAGLRYKVNATIDIWIEFSIRYLFTDYIDDVSRNYVDLGVLPSDLSRALSYRGNEIGPVSALHTYTGRDNKIYRVEAGYGSEHPDNMRGSRNDNDLFTSFGVRVSKILKQNMHRAKFR